ncbi:MAG: tetratricopeptide repeat protein [Bacteroidia bacterium]|nr:tetratricopeptide repeat protein [Bacteroidia bacterium]
MKEQNRNINGNSWKDPDLDLQLTAEDSALFKTISEYMKGRLDLEEVRNDPSLPEMNIVVRKMISDYRGNIANRTDDEKFIRDNFTGICSEEELLDEISRIKLEAEKNNIDEISAGWVKEWHEKRQKNAGRESETDKIRDFITSSLQSEKSEPEIRMKYKDGKGLKRSLMVRYISLSAAAVIGVLIILRTLLPSSDPEKLYNSYYIPFNVLSPVTRSVTTNEPESYSSAVEKYKSGNYQTAAIGFSDAILKDTSVIAPRFFKGISELAMGNYDQAVNLLGTVAGRSGEYRKEAEWYLGLAYLKTGDKEKAAKCFEKLAQSPGFYSERAAKILRRL